MPLAATLHVEIGQLSSVSDEYKFNVIVRNDGEMMVLINLKSNSDEAADSDGGRMMAFLQDEWCEFKRRVIATDEAIAQLRKKNLIYDFNGGPDSHKNEPQLPAMPPAPPVPVPRKPDEICFEGSVVSKLNRQGEVVRRVVRTQDEIEAFKREEIDA